MEVKGWNHRVWGARFYTLRGAYLVVKPKRDGIEGLTRVLPALFQNVTSFPKEPAREEI
jgi:hypothetical protein